MIGVALGTMALVIVLSVYNGMGGLIQSLFNSFDPEIEIVSSHGKSFPTDSTFIKQIKNIEGVAVVSEVIEDNAYARYHNAEMVVKLKGVSDNYAQQSGVLNYIVDGKFELKEKERNFAVVGRGVEYTLSINTRNDFYPLVIYYPKKGKISSVQINNLFNKEALMVKGIFSIEKRFDMSYVFVPLSFTEKLLDYKNQRTSLELKLNPDYSVEEVKENLEKFLGTEFTVKDREEQQATLMKILRIERLFLYLSLGFILLVASFNIFFTLSMLALEKKKDISILYALGVRKKMITKIFLIEGFMISLSGSFIGLLLGLIICSLQVSFGWVKMAIISNTGELMPYPVEIKMFDLSVISILIIAITLLAAYRPASIAAKFNNADNL